MTIDVVLVTWPNHPKRLEYLRITLQSMACRLTASRHDLRYLCSSESQRDPDSTWHGEELQDMCSDLRMPLHWHDGPASLGAGMNNALRCCESDLVLLVQDDYMLLEPLDLSPGADAILADPAIDMIRYRYYVSPPHSTQFDGERGGFRCVKMDGPWPYGDDPHLRHSRMNQRHGLYVEGIGHASEGEMLHRLKRQNACILAADRLYFEHIGSVSAVPVSQELRPRAVGR